MAVYLILSTSPSICLVQHSPCFSVTESGLVSPFSSFHHVAHSIIRWCPIISWSAYVCLCCGYVEVHIDKLQFCPSLAPLLSFQIQLQTNSVHRLTHCCLSDESYVLWLFVEVNFYALVLSFIWPLLLLQTHPMVLGSMLRLTSTHQFCLSSDHSCHFRCVLWSMAVCWGYLYKPILSFIWPTFCHFQMHPTVTLWVPRWSVPRPQHAAKILMKMSLEMRNWEMISCLSRAVILDKYPEETWTVEMVFDKTERDRKWRDSDNYLFWFFCVCDCYGCRMWKPAALQESFTLVDTNTIVVLWYLKKQEEDVSVNSTSIQWRMLSQYCLGQCWRAWHCPDITEGAEPEKFMV